MYDWILHEAWLFVKEWIWIPLVAMYVSVIITILIENRQPNKTISWILVIILVPVAGVALYYIFGQKFNKVKLFQERNKKHSIYVKSRWEELLPAIETTLEKLEDRIDRLSKVYDFLVNQKLSLPTRGNQVTLLVNGEEKFPKLFEAIEKARHHIHLEYYIFERDALGEKMLGLLAKKTKQGVQVRLIIDAFGSPRVARKRYKLDKMGIETVVFLPVGIASLANSNYRNHRKTAIIDGQVAFIGGINISDRYVNGSAKKRYWRDTSVCIEGPSVNSLQLYFWLDWAFAEGRNFSLTPDFLYAKSRARIFDLPLNSDAGVGFSFSDPGSPAPYNMEVLLLAIYEAKTCITLCTPYFIPSEELSTALQLAAATGVRVELMLPEKGDSFIVQHASMSFLKPLLERGVHVYTYQKGFIHAKTVCVDGKLAFVGTVNLDTRSFYINFEAMAIIEDPMLCIQMEQQFELDKTLSQKIDLQLWLDRPKWKRGMDSLCRLFAPLL